MAQTTKNWVRGSPLGRGSFGTVNLALDTSPDGGSRRHVFAVKSVALNPADSISLFSLANEIQILKSLSSPYVVAYLGDDTTVDARAGARRNLHLEFLPGGTAADRSFAGEAEVRAVARRVVRALRYLHDFAGVVHCDVKGRNVLLGEAPGAAKLADFGAAVRVSDRDRWNAAPRGTPQWMAPEVARGEPPRPESDVWSLGCTVIEMATGAPPWAEWAVKDAADVMFRIGYASEVPEFPPWLSELGWDFLDKCLRRDPRERWTAAKLLQHPFVAEAGAGVPSPTGVLDWVDWELRHVSGDDYGGEICGVGSVNSLDGARARVMELASGGGTVAWYTEGWEEVRGEEEGLVDMRCGDEEPEICCGDSKYRSLGLQEDRIDNEENEGDLFAGTRCSVSSSCNSSCCFCECNLIFHHGRCDSFLHQVMGINVSNRWCSPLDSVNKQSNSFSLLLSSITSNYLQLTFFFYCLAINIRTKDSVV